MAGALTRRRYLGRDTAGLTTSEYVILLLVVACVGIAAWKLFGSSTMARATSASGDVGELGQSIDGPTRGGGGRAQTGPRTSSRLDDATADATPPPNPQEELKMPFILLAGALLLLIAMAAMRMRKGGGGDGGDGGGDQKE